MLPTGTFTARAEQSRQRRQHRLQLAGHVHDHRRCGTTAPAVTIGYPVAIYNDTAVFSGLAGGVAGDLGLITVRVYPA